MNIRLFVAIAAIVLAGCSARKNLNTSPQTLRVMTYNVHHANPPAEKEGVINLPAIAEIIRKEGAELVAIQELDSVTGRSGKVYQLKELAKILNMHYYYGGAIPYGGGAYGVGLLSKFPISEAKTIHLPRLPEPKVEERVLALVKVHLPGKRIIYFGSTHLDVNKEANRELQAQKIVDVAKTLGAPVIIGGDMNAMPGSGTMNSFESYFTIAGTKNEPTIPNINPKRKIDFVIYAGENDFELKNERVVTTANWESDHLPFWVDLEIK